MKKILSGIVITVMGGLILAYSSGVFFPSPSPKPPTVVIKPPKIVVEPPSSQSQSNVLELFEGSIRPLSSNNPYSDQRVRAAIRELLAPDRGGPGAIKEAKSRLAEAGWPNGFSLTLSSSDFEGRKTDKVWIQRRLKSRGVDLNFL